MKRPKTEINDSYKQVLSVYSQSQKQQWSLGNHLAFKKKKNETAVYDDDLFFKDSHLQ